MICDHLSSLLGLDCSPISDDGNVALIATPFTFDDGDSVPIYVQHVNGQLRFFDDGGVLLHLMGRGMNFEDGRRSKFIKTAAEPHGVSLSDSGELEVWAPIEKAPPAFAGYLSTLLAVTSWERDQRGVGTDMIMLIDEVEMCLRAWKPKAELVAGPEFEGISGQSYKMDFLFDGEPILATSAHPNSVSSAIKKLLDIRGSNANSGLSVLVVIDDRADHQAAMKDSLIIQTVAKVMPFTRLEENAKGIHRNSDVALQLSH